jgi:F-type H+-transporting ATPase subunit gamma
MESIQNLKRRIKGVQNIGQITKAMELVAATKMRKAQEVALDSRPYAYAALEILATLSKLENVPIPVLMQGREIKKTLFVLVTSDKGLAGSFNGAVIRKFEKYMAGIPASEVPKDLEGRVSFLAIGQKSKQYLERQKLPVAQSFVRAGDFTKRAESDPIAQFIINGYVKGDWDEVVIFSTLFVTALRQDVIQRQLLPVTFENLKETAEELIPRAGRYSDYIDPDAYASEDTVEYIIEPSPREVLDRLAPELLKIRLYDWLMEANASEHSARRMAMKSASDNAGELSQNLSVEYNKSRQAAITSQIIEITSGAQSN